MKAPLNDEENKKFKALVDTGDVWIGITDTANEGKYTILVKTFCESGAVNCVGGVTFFLILNQISLVGQFLIKPLKMQASFEIVPTRITIT